MDRMYKGFRIGTCECSNDITGNTTSRWVACRNNHNIYFDTLREAKEWINNYLKKTK